MAALPLDFWQPGNIVKLRRAYKPSSFQQEMLRLAGTADDLARQRIAETYERWSGFLYGIIAHVYSSGRGQVAQFLYDPRFHLLYMAAQQIPIFVDFAVDELVPYKDSRQVNYETLSGE